MASSHVYSAALLPLFIVWCSLPCRKTYGDRPAGYWDESAVNQFFGMGQSFAESCVLAMTRQFPNDRKCVPLGDIVVCVQRYGHYSLPVGKGTKEGCWKWNNAGWGVDAAQFFNTKDKPIVSGNRRHLQTVRIRAAFRFWHAASGGGGNRHFDDAGFSEMSKLVEHDVIGLGLGVVTSSPPPRVLHPSGPHYIFQIIFQLQGAVSYLPLCHFAPSNAWQKYSK